MTKILAIFQMLGFLKMVLVPAKRNFFIITKQHLYLLEKIRKASTPICKSSAVYLLLKANPMVIPAIIQNHFLSSKIALYRHNILKVQNNNKGTSGVELKVDNTAKKIDLVNGEYRQQMKTMRSYIKQLEEKIKLIDVVGSIEKTKTVESVKKSVDQENITLEITDK